jgi:hypothetical protein
MVVNMPTMRRRWNVWSILLPLVVSMGLIVGCGNDGTKTDGAKPGAPATTLAVPVASDSDSSLAPTPDDTSSAPALSQSKVGGTVSIVQTDNSGKEGHGSYTVHSMRVAAPPDEYSHPDKGEFVVVDVTFAVTSGQMDYNPYDFSLQTVDDRVWEPAVGTFDPAFSSGTANVGQKIRGYITFDIPKIAVTQLQLNGGSNGVIAVWTTH